MPREASREMSAKGVLFSMPPRSKISAACWRSLSIPRARTLQRGRGGGVVARSPSNLATSSSPAGQFFSWLIRILPTDLTSIGRRRSAPRTALPWSLHRVIRSCGHGRFR